MLSSISGETEAQERSAVWPCSLTVRMSTGSQVGSRACTCSHARPCLFFLLASCEQCSPAMLLLVPAAHLSILTSVFPEGFLYEKNPLESLSHSKSRLRQERRSPMPLSSLFPEGPPPTTSPPYIVLSKMRCEGSLNPKI